MVTKTYKDEFSIGQWDQFIGDLSIDYDFTPDQRIIFKRVRIDKITNPDTISLEWLNDRPSWKSWLLNKLSGMIVDRINDRGTVWKILMDHAITDRTNSNVN